MDLIQFHKYVLKAYCVPTQLFQPICPQDPGSSVYTQVWQGDYLPTSRLYETYPVTTQIQSYCKNSKGGSYISDSCVSQGSQTSENKV